MWIGATDRYSIYYKDKQFTIYDKRMDSYLPFTLQGEDAEEFKEAINVLPIITDDSLLDKEIDDLCERMKNRLIIRS